MLSTFSAVPGASVTYPVEAALILFEYQIIRRRIRHLMLVTEGAWLVGAAFFVSQNRTSFLYPTHRFAYILI
jgi:hypothetical protein